MSKVKTQPLVFGKLTLDLPNVYTHVLDARLFRPVPPIFIRGDYCRVTVEDVIVIRASIK